ncbi:7,8-dihydropterin-6-yl-methyl-4-(beta-D-ribofuranosyl)aminobenzene 5'-phosphate synthase [Saccharicrinis carchari]|uniref:7,8-dihydropterin-6-yl-methyl-4-(Beta-D-ribofuranosyl)aminobenzene 5'-phosphate synthase n=1 Tax=Saccharicrinis carchari TaxID=1168039 RepID=A0A521CLC7_SACCC|nr:MBL fold metallo-hydrolase [Saccharicrinis carchari]SMO60228.1 7,8-dihydropterin-6-yl-methyl-4-(beta-D-ribofuranosyl)aminobenzene 5'-phosphate synthase [Saccharicrinis carchari]
MEITVLIDNKKNTLAYRSEHGLSILIEFNGATVLFDTGKSDAFIQNAKILGKDLGKVDYVVLSHAHYDHTGGLEDFLILNKTAKVVLKEDVLRERWSVSHGYNRRIGFPLRKRFEQFNERYHFIKATEEIVPGLFVFPEIKKPTNHSFTDSYLFVQEKGSLVPDTFNDELFMAAVNDNKLVVFTGCAHNGVENMIKTAIDYTQINEIEFMIGGTHLNRASEQQIVDTANQLSQFCIKRAAFNHCSGKRAIDLLKTALKGRVEYGYAGTSFRV